MPFNTSRKRKRARVHESQKSCSLLEMGTLSRCPSGPGASSSLLVSERLRNFKHCQDSTANYARRTSAPKGATHQSTVSLVTLATVPRGQFGGYAANPSFIIGLRPRGCLLVLLRRCAMPGGFNARTQSLGPSRNSAQGRCCFAVSPPSMPTGRSLCQWKYSE